MPGSLSRHDAQTVTSFAFEPVNQTPRFLVSEFGCFTTAIAEHGPLLVLKIAGHFVRYAAVLGCLLLIRARETRAYLLPFEIRFALFEECADAFVFVFARKTEREQIDFATQPFVEV